MIFKDRRDAGRALSRIMPAMREWKDGIVLGLPRGGVPVGFEVARALGLPLDVLVVQKLGVPGHEELAMGAVASGGTRVMNERVIRELGISEEALETATRREMLEVERREKAYRKGRPPLPIEGRTAILVDDGLATGASMTAAARAARPVAREVVVAAPVGAPATCDEMSREADAVICVLKPERFIAVGMFYRNFQPVTEDEVRALLVEAHTSHGEKRDGAVGKAA